MVNLINAKFSCILFKMQVFIMVDYGKIVDEKVLANSTKMCYTYDSLNRVTSRTVKSLADNSVISTETYTYDAAGNLTDAPDSCFGYDINNRLTVFNGNDVSYDMDGNMLSNGTTDFEYDSANRLIKAGNHAYTYNAEDVRIRNLCGDYDTTYTYNTNCKLSQLLQKTTNGIITKYVYGLGLIGEEKQECGFKTYHFDYRGSTVAITDISGNITDTFKYDTYGKVTEHIGDSFVIFGYNGRDGVVTDKNGLIYMRARYYSPAMRRFVNADIIHDEISNAVTLNRYAYANGNPVSNTDPFGLAAEERGSSNAFNTIIDFFRNDTHSIYGEFLYKLLFGSGSISGGKSEFGYSFGGSKNYYPKKSATQWESFFGALAEITVANANGEIGIGNENISLSIDGDLDLLTAYAKAGARSH